MTVTIVVVVDVVVVDVVANVVVVAAVVDVVIVVVVVVVVVVVLVVVDLLRHLSSLPDNIRRFVVFGLLLGFPASFLVAAVSKIKFRMAFLLDTALLL